MTHTTFEQDWFKQTCKTINLDDINAAKTHQAALTKPAGSLGLLEEIAISFSAWQQTNSPSLNSTQIAVFAGDHGVCAQGVSAFPQEVTAQMIFNFCTGGAAISVLANEIGAQFSVVNMGVNANMDDAPNLINVPLMSGTNDFTIESAMTQQTLLAALQLGRQQVDPNASLFIGGDMGIGNTTSASAIYSLLLKLPAETTVGPGTGVDKDGLAIKRQCLYRAFNKHAENLETPLGILQHVGGLEIAGLVGAYIECAQKGVPILVDGFITTAAALLAEAINPNCRDWMLFAHKSAEPAHTLALESLKATPILDLGMRLGEGSGAGVAVSIIKSALALHSNMATFATAGVSES